jgi:hypothetical protein
MKLLKQNIFMIDSQNNKLPFKDFLDKSTNLITIFGVLNALFVYTTTIDNETAQAFLLPSFFVLSLLVWLEIIKFGLKSGDNSVDYTLFYFLACSIEIGLIIYFVSIFSSLVVLVGALAIIFLLTFLFVNIITRIFTMLVKKSSKLIKLFGGNRKAFENLAYVFIIIAFIASILVFKAILHFANPWIENIQIIKSVLK